MNRIQKGDLVQVIEPHLETGSFADDERLSLHSGKYFRVNSIFDEGDFIRIESLSGKLLGTWFTRRFKKV